MRRALGSVQGLSLSKLPLTGSFHNGLGTLWHSGQEDGERQGGTDCPVHGSFRGWISTVYELGNQSLHSLYGEGQQFSTSVLQELLKHALPDYLVRALAFFPSDCQIVPANDNTTKRQQPTRHNHPV